VICREFLTLKSGHAENARESVLVLDEGLRVTLANPVCYRTFQVSPEETHGRLIYELGNRQWNIPKLRELFHEITAHNTRMDGFEVRHKFQHLGFRHMILNARRIQPHGGLQMILLSIEDVTKRKIETSGAIRAPQTLASRQKHQ
jgi:PAS domain-containing protein